MARDGVWACMCLVPKKAVLQYRVKGALKSVVVLMQAVLEFPVACGISTGTPVRVRCWLYLAFGLPTC